MRGAVLAAHSGDLFIWEVVEENGTVDLEG
jgi:hypothetical protein